MGEQCRRGQPLGDHALGRWRLMDCSASAAAIFRAPDADYPQFCRNPVKHLADRLARWMQVAATTGAALSFHIHRHVEARQSLVEHDPARCGLAFGTAGLHSGIARLRASKIDLCFFEAERQLISVKTLRALPELRPAELGDHQLEPFDLVAAGLDDGRHVAHEAVQKVYVMG